MKPTSSTNVLDNIKSIHDLKNKRQNLDQTRNKREFSLDKRQEIAKNCKKREFSLDKRQRNCKNLQFT